MDKQKEELFDKVYSCIETWLGYEHEKVKNATEEVLKVFPWVNRSDEEPSQDCDRDILIGIWNSSPEGQWWEYRVIRWNSTHKAFIDNNTGTKINSFQIWQPIIEKEQMILGSI